MVIGTLCTCSTKSSKPVLQVLVPRYVQVLRVPVEMYSVCSVKQLPRKSTTGSNLYNYLYVLCPRYFLVVNLTTKHWVNCNLDRGTYLV